MIRNDSGEKSHPVPLEEGRRRGRGMSTLVGVSLSFPGESSLVSFSSLVLALFAAFVLERLFVLLLLLLFLIC